MTSGGNNFNHFAENQLTIFSARDAGDFSDAAGKREMAPRCARLGRSVSVMNRLQTFGLTNPQINEPSDY